MTATISRLEDAYSIGDVELYFHTNRIESLDARMDTMRALLSRYGNQDVYIFPPDPPSKLRLVRAGEDQYTYMADVLVRNNILTNFANDTVMTDTLLDRLPDSGQQRSA